MFVSHEKSPSKMKFQKPNILRKRPKCTSKSNIVESSNNIILQGQPQMNFVNIQDWNLEFTKHKCGKLTHFIKKPVTRIKLESYISEEKVRNCNFGTNDVANELVQINNKEENAGYPEIINGSNSSGVQNCAFDIEQITIKDLKEVSSIESKWCFLPITEDMKNKAKYEESQGREAADTSTIITIEKIPGTVVVLNTDVAGNEEAAKHCVAVTELLPNTYMCDAADCDKEFPNEQRLKKHKQTIHNKSGTQRVQSIDCPANKPGESTLCGEIFTVREDVLNHLKEQHTLDDAVHRCTTCARHFFWSAGLRAHWRACGGATLERTLLACPWPGCGRVFYQPCRLKEHTRAHTGDKPYPCRYPNCNWSFRTASKLLRHARRHTGERRHRCEQCGRAFLRGEHLREHIARHARPSKPPGKQRAKRKRVERLISLPFVEEAPVPDPMTVETPLLCLQLKSEASETIVPPGTTTDVTSPSKAGCDWSDEEDPFFVTVHSPATSTPTPELCTASERLLERSARTHCTWPLSRASTEVYVLEHDAQVELSEATETESKIYTIRSDLFLHGNVIHNEDSESGVAVTATSTIEQETGEVGGCEGSVRDAELGLDATSAIDLMQEELMYTAAATDESSFQPLSDGEYHYWLAT